MGDLWRINTNWNVGDPCTNYWYGVRCNYLGNVIALNFFENSLNAQNGFDDTFVNLINLMHLTIINGDTEFEWHNNTNKNVIKNFPI